MALDLTCETSLVRLKDRKERGKKYSSELARKREKEYQRAFIDPSKKVWSTICEHIDHIKS